MELLEAAKGAGGDNPQMVVMQRADLACDLLILGQTLTTDVGSSGSRALGDVHASVRADIIDSAAAWLAEVLNEQLVPAIWMMNHGVPGEESELPWYEPSRKAMRDAKVLAETMEILQRCGVAIPEDWAYEVMDIPKPEEGEMVLKPVQAAAPAAPSMPPMLGKADALRAIATMPVEAREYFLSRLDLKASGDQPRENDGRFGSKPGGAESSGGHDPKKDEPAKRAGNERTGQGRTTTQKKLPTIKDVMDSAQDPDSHDFCYYQKVSAEDAATLKDRTGLDLSGYTRIVCASEVNKILKKHTKDHRPITPEDILNVESYLSRAHSSRLVIREGRNANSIEHIVNEGGVTLVIAEEVRVGRRQLALLSMYRK